MNGLDEISPDAFTDPPGGAVCATGGCADAATVPVVIGHIVGNLLLELVDPTSPAGDADRIEWHCAAHAGAVTPYDERT